MRLPRVTSIVREPARLSLRVWERGLSGALTVVQIAREMLEPEDALGPRRESERARSGNGGPPAAAAEPELVVDPEPVGGESEAVGPERLEDEPGLGGSEPAESAATATEPAAPARAAADHVDSEAVLVAEVAEQGAEDGAGAELHVDEPWEGYDEMGAAEVRRRLSGTDRAAAAAVKLYETTRKKRRSVIEAADRRLAG